MYETEQTSHERRSNDTFNVSKFQKIFQSLKALALQGCADILCYINFNLLNKSLLSLSFLQRSHIKGMLM